MQITQLVQWSLWGLSLLAGIGAILALFKLRLSERFLPPWNELKELEAMLPVRREELRQVTEAMQTHRQELAKLEGEVGHLQQLREWQEANPDAPARIQQMMTDLERNKAELTVVQQKLAQEEARLNDIAREVQRSTQEKAQLAEQIPPLRDQLAGLHKQKGDLEATLADLDDQRRQIELRLSSLKNDLQSNENRLATLRHQVEKAEQEKAKVDRERKEAEAVRDAARAEKAGLEKAIDQLKELAKGMQVTLERAGVTSSKGYADLFAPVFRDEPRRPRYLPPRGATSEERTALELTRDYIKSKGFIFPERVLHAFHTSLKASDISPLVVLAGISGTGKSELPRHYADGMGFHFLLSAVQPRWDSPQDLFGFYNYLEKRYKATELSRALVQFEMFNREILKEIAKEQAEEGRSDLDDRSDRMLLVLLDEMNLARTEYYFSEFLSKLETRRMVDEGNAQDRARAQIELDMGSLLKGQKSLHLYPGRNVLFVGTMNEDESTQALSDKVIDRASVVRFWKPKNMSQGQRPHERPKPDHGLTFENWKRWLRDPANLDGNEQQVSTWITELNDALEKLGRPFAFRVDRAIRYYIANYPREGVADWHRLAMADQIEQRIFPKLRGVETEQAHNSLQRIGNVIEDLGDVPLKQAYKASYENQPTFLFRGVVRSDD